MARSFYPWADGLDDQAFAGALAGAGLLPIRVSDRSEIEDFFRRKLASPRPVLLSSFPLPHSPWNREVSPREVAELFHRFWRERIASAGDRALVRTLAIPGRIVRQAGYEWLDAVRRVLEEGLSADQLVVHAPSSYSASWSWPVRIGVLSSLGGLGPFSGFDTGGYRSNLVRIAGAGTAPQRYDLLLIDTEDLSGLGQLEASDADGTVVVALGNRFGRLEAEIQVLEAIRAMAGAPVAVRQERPADPREWLGDLVDELAHTTPINLALHRASGIHEVRAPEILADLGALGRLGLIPAAHALLGRSERARLRSLPAMPRLETTPRMRDDLGMSGSALPHEIAERLDGQVETLAFGREIEGASTIGEATSVIEAASRGAVRRNAALEISDPTSETGPRVLRARLGRDGKSVSTVEPVRLEPDTVYEIQVSIGQQNRDWLSEATAFPVPETRPDDPTRGWRLRVVAWEPTVLPTPQEKVLWLREQGETETATFPFGVPEGLGSIGARVTVLHGNRVLQTGVLAVENDRAPTWRIDSAPEPQLVGLDPDRWFALSMVLNDDVAGVPRATVFSDHSLGVVALTQAPLDQFTSDVERGLKLIADHPEQFDRLDKPATVELLTKLAQSGATLLRSIVRGTLIQQARLDAAERIQIVSTHAHTHLPAEFLYVFPPPKEGAMLCPGASQGLTSRDGKCVEQHSPDHVCPTGFWSLRKVIERHAHVPENTVRPGPFELIADQGFATASKIAPLRAVLYGASDIADEYDANATSAVETAAETVAGLSHRVRTWSEWRQEIAGKHPSLLLLLPHHSGQDKLEIGTGDSLLPSQIWDDVVRAPGTGKPLVFLIGCKTLLTKRAFDDIVQGFAWSGAAAVVSTYATILGRHAAPATTELLRELKSQLDNGETRLGDVLVAIRRKLLAQGAPMALGLTSYGDADVLLTRVV